MSPVPEPVPSGYPTVTPYLCIDGATEAIKFYTDVFGATERMRIPAPDGKVGHAEIEIGNSVVMLSDEWPDMQVFGPRTVGGTPVTLSVYVPDVDATFGKAVAAGAKPIQEVENKFYGDRSGQFEDPFGHRWNVLTHVEDVSADEMQRRAAEVMGASTT